MSGVVNTIARAARSVSRASAQAIRHASRGRNRPMSVVRGRSRIPVHVALPLFGRWANEVPGSNAYPNRQGGFAVRKGASSSKSRGKFRKGTARTNDFDKFAKKGAVIAQEMGGVLAGTSGDANSKVQSILIGHSNFTGSQVFAVAAMGMVKLIANKLGRTIASFDDVIETTGNGNALLTIRYKDYPFGVDADRTATITAGSTTWLLLAKAIHDFFQLTKESTVWTTMTYDENTNGTLTHVRKFEIDLSRAKIQLLSKSSLKIQNRTINTAGLADAEDVDNVPIYGKSYDSSGNYLACRSKQSDIVNIATGGQNYLLSPFNAVASNGYIPIVTELATPTNGYQQFAEPVPKSCWANCKAIGKAHLDPGVIKTSVLYHKGGMSFMNFMRKSFLYNASDYTTAIGKNRLFILEKMIQAVATNTTTQENTLRVAYELDCKVGCIVTCPSVTFSHMKLYRNVE